jgi:hypothetical protein
MKLFSHTLLALCMPFGMTSLARALAPMVLTHPESQMIQTGASTTLSVVVDVSGPLTYQWKKDGVDLPSSNSPTYTLSNAQGTNAGSYTVVVTNADGSCEAGPAAVFVGTRRTVFVSSSAAGSNNGTSWTNAYTSLTTALSNALDGDDIWVAAGTYKPSTTSNRDATFTVAKFVRLFGGFNGTETALEQRNWNANVTTLSGDLAGNDTGLGGNQGDNSKRVVTISSTSGAVVDGFTIRGGSNTVISAPDYGMGIGVLSINSSMRVKNCAFRWNNAVSYGGALGHFLGNASSPLIVESCSFTQNAAPANGGGAIEVENAQLLVKDSYFAENTGSGSGAVTLNNSRGLVVVNSVFASNASGGGMQPHVGAGALRGWSTYNANYRIYGCTMRNNSNTRGTEGAVSLSTSASSGSLFANSIVVGSGSNPVAFPLSNYLLSDQTISGTGNTVGSPVFVNTAAPLGADDIFGSADDGLALQPGSPGINAGSDSLVPAAITVDAAGRPRLSQKVDMGAYELPQPQISQHPVSVALNQNNGTNFSVTAAGSGTLTYQWQKDGVDIPGATSSTFSLASAKPWHIGDYTVKVTDANGTITSNAATLSLTGINSGIWKGLTGYYKLDSEASDRSVLGQDLIISGATPNPDRFSQSIGAFSFNGLGNSIYKSGLTGPDASSAQSISVWFKAGFPINDALLAGSAIDGNARFHISIKNGRLEGAHGNDSNFQYHEFGSATLQSGTWYHAVLTTTGNAGAMNAYLNGVAIGQAPSGTNTPLTSNYWIQLGSVASSSFIYNFKGEIDDVRFYNRAISGAEVAALYAAENAPNNWRQTYFGSTSNTGSAADDVDPDGDGLKNLLEYALNLPPNAVSRVPATVQATGGNLEYLYERSTAAFNGGTTYQVEWSDDLTTWSSAGVVETLLSDDDTYQQVKATLPAGSGGRRFVRLRVQ